MLDEISQCPALNGKFIAKLGDVTQTLESLGTNEKNKSVYYYYMYMSIF